MLHRILTLSLCALLLSMLISFESLLLAPTTYTFADAKPELKLNLQQGPLGVTLTLQGKNFHPGQAALSYIDSQGTPGTFMPPSDTSVQVGTDGSFSTTNLIMPTSGPTGGWRIIVTDSVGTVALVRYLVLAAPGQQTAGAPSLTINPTSGMSGAVIAFSGSNWLPQGTAVNLMLVVGSTSSQLLNTPPVSDANGMIAGSFHLPQNLTASQATVSATDAATGDLGAQAQIVIISPSPTPSASPTPHASPTPTATSVPTPTTVPTPTSTASPGTSGRSSGPANPLSTLDRQALGLVLLIVGGALGLAALMLILFLVPWRERRSNEPRSGQF